jgi:hypothetical protein
MDLSTIATWFGANSGAVISGSFGLAIGYVVSKLNHHSNFRKDSVALRRQKLEALYESVSTFTSKYYIVYLQFSIEWGRKKLSRENILHSDLKEITRIRMLVFMYFPELQGRLDEMQAIMNKAAEPMSMEPRHDIDIPPEIIHEYQEKLRGVSGDMHALGLNMLDDIANLSRRLTTTKW